MSTLNPITILVSIFFFAAIYHGVQGEELTRAKVVFGGPTEDLYYSAKLFSENGDKNTVIKEESGKFGTKMFFDSKLKIKMSGSVGVESCMWTESFTDRKDCAEKVEKFLNELEKKAGGRRLTLMKSSSTQAIWGALIRLFSRFALPVIRSIGATRALMLASRAVRAWRVVKNFKHWNKLKWGLRAGELGLAGWTIAEFVKLKQLRDNMEEIQAALLQITGKSVGPFIGGRVFNCDESIEKEITRAFTLKVICKDNGW